MFELNLSQTEYVTGGKYWLINFTERYPCAITIGTLGLAYESWLGAEEGSVMSHTVPYVLLGALCDYLLLKLV